jgi:hypothetical protein
MQKAPETGAFSLDQLHPRCLSIKATKTRHTPVDTPETRWQIRLAATFRKPYATAQGQDDREKR